MLRRFIKNFNTLQNGLAYLLYAHLLFFSANTQTNKVKSVVQWRKKNARNYFILILKTFYFISDVWACFDDACFLDTTLFQIIIRKNKKFGSTFIFN